MTLIFLALLIGVGVLFGMASLVMDLGYGMGQTRAMQNGSDAAVMAATRLLAGSAGPGPGNPPTLIYTVSNATVHQKAQEFASFNRPGGLSSSDYAHIGVEYLPCSGASPMPNWTANSDPDIVSEVGGTRQTTTSALVPAWTCKLRVFTRVVHNAIFASALGRSTVGETSRATAAISGSALPSVFTDVWPITRWTCNGDDERATSPDGCDDTEEQPCTWQVSNPCTFWSSNSDPQGSFKHYVDMSRYSGLAKDAGIPDRYQHLYGWPDPDPPGPAPTVQYDTSHPGTNDRQTDIPHWIKNGWKGRLRISDTDPLCTTPTLNDTSLTAGVVRDCTNSRLETFREVQGQGDLGQNIASAMREYIDARKEANDAGVCGFSGSNNTDNDYATATVFFWRYGEQDTELNNSIGLLDQSRIWGHFGDSFPDSENQLKRIVVHRAARFQFCRGHVASSSVRGQFVAFVVEVGGGGGGGSPSTVANSVSLAN